MARNTKTIALAAMVGMAVSALMPGGFRWDAWLFGVLTGLAQGLIGLHFHRVALSRSTFAFGPALASGALRVAALLAAYAVALRSGFPAAPFAWTMLTMYVAMMTAEISTVARLANAIRVEAR